jgi:hypothetical protein
MGRRCLSEFFFSICQSLIETQYKLDDRGLARGRLGVNCFDGVNRRRSRATILQNLPDEPCVEEFAWTANVFDCESRRDSPTGMMTV